MNLASIIEPHPAEAVAFRQDGRSFTYGDLRDQARAARIDLVSHGVERGDRVALVFPTTPGFAVGYFATLACGAVAVPLNPESPVAELATELGTVRAKVVLLGGPRVAALRRPLADLGYVVLELGADGRLIGDGDGGGNGNGNGDGGGNGNGNGTSPTGRAAASGSDDPASPLECAPEDLAVLLFTSGTAGSPKAAMLTHGNLRANIDQMELAVGLAPTVDDVGLLVVPPFHIYGLNAVLGITLYAGASLVLMERFDPGTLLELVRTEGITILPGVPQLFAALADYAPASGEELRSVRLAISGAAPLSLEVAERFATRFGVEIWQAYGLTEAAPSVTFPDQHAARRPLAVGVPLPGIEVKIVDGDGASVEHGDPGEILVRGPNVFLGYFEDAGASKAALDGAGWLHTGDVGVMDDDGSLTIVDRSKDLVIVSGFNVFPAEVEHVLEAHPAVAEVVVLGVPDAGSGESVRAFVVPAGDAWPEDAPAPTGVDEAELIEYCAGRLARYKCPSSVVFVRSLPRGLQGKALRRALA